VNYCELWAMDADGGNARKVAHIPDYPFINWFFAKCSGCQRC
jgi:hypothetical protein